MVCVYVDGYIKIQDPTVFMLDQANCHFAHSFHFLPLPFIEKGLLQFAPFCYILLILLYFILFKYMCLHECRALPKWVRATA